MLNCDPASQRGRTSSACAIWRTCQLSDASHVSSSICFFPGTPAATVHPTRLQRIRPPIRSRRPRVHCFGRTPRESWFSRIARLPLPSCAKQQPVPAGAECGTRDPSTVSDGWAQLIRLLLVSRSVSAPLVLACDQDVSLFRSLTNSNSLSSFLACTQPEMPEEGSAFLCSSLSPTRLQFSPSGYVTHVILALLGTGVMVRDPQASGLKACPPAPPLVLGSGVATGMSHGLNWYHGRCYCPWACTNPTSQPTACRNDKPHQLTDLGTFAARRHFLYSEAIVEAASAERALRFSMASGHMRRLNGLTCEQLCRQCTVQALYSGKDKGLRNLALLCDGVLRPIRDCIIVWLLLACRITKNVKCFEVAQSALSPPYFQSQ